MAKKFGKFLLLTAAVGSAAAAVYYYMQKKGSVTDIPEDEDYDDFSDTLNEDDSARNYVSLNPEGKTDAPAEENSEKQDTFTPLSEQVKKTEEAVEEFFDEDDPAEDTPVSEK